MYLSISVSWIQGHRGKYQPLSVSVDLFDALPHAGLACQSNPEIHKVVGFLCDAEYCHPHGPMSGCKASIVHAHCVPTMQ